MNDEGAHPESDRQPPVQDSRLKSFLRQSAGIIAAEKGLSPACRLKLKALADRINLPDDLFQQGMEQLQSGQLDVDNLTRYEAAFLKFLGSEFRKLSSEVLSPKRENAAREIATSKYQIQPFRAEQLINAQCEADGISRIAPDEAAAYAEQVILQQVGDRTFVDDNFKVQLHKLGATWGLDELAVDQIAVSAVNQNRRHQHASTPRRIGPLSVLLGLLILIAIGVWCFQYLPNKTTEQPGAKPPPEPASDPSAGPGNGPSLDSETRGMVNAILARPVGQALSTDILNQLSGEGGQQRAEAMSQIVKCLLKETPTNEQAAAVLTHLLNRESDPQPIVAALSPLFSALEPTSSESPPAISDWKAAYRADQLLQSVEPQLSKLPPEAVALIAQQRPQWLPPMETSPVQGARRIRQGETVIARQQWNQLLRLAFRRSSQAASLVAPLLELTEGRLSEAQHRQVLSQVLLTILQSDIELFPRVQPACLQLIASSEPAELIRWVELVREHRDSDQARQLAVHLAEKMAAREVDPRAPFEPLDQYLFQFRYRQLEPLMNRTDLLNSQTERALNRDWNKLTQEELPDQIARTASLVNLELKLLLMIENRAWSSLELEQIDSGIRLANLRLRDKIALPFDSQPGEGETSPNLSAPTASDIRRKNAALAALPDAQLSMDRKLMALSQLERVAGRFDDLPYAEAESLARYLLSDIPLEAQLEIQKLAGSFGHWNQLSLAVADQLAATEVSRDRALTLARLLLKRELSLPPDINQPNDWRIQLSNRLLQAVNQNLALKISRRPDSELNQWLRLSEALTNVYQNRLQQLESEQATTPAPSSIETLSRRCFRLAANRLGGDGVEDPGRLEVNNSVRVPGSDVIKQMASNPLDQVVLYNQLLVQSFLDSRQFSDLQIPSWKTLQNRLTLAQTVGQRVLISESILLELLSKRRQESTRRMLEE